MSLNQWLLKFQRTIVTLLSGSSSPEGHSSQHKSTDPSKCQQTSPNNTVSHSRRLKSCVCITGSVEWYPLVWSGANCYRLACLSTAVITAERNHSTKWRGPEMVWRTAKSLAKNWTSDHPACSRAMYKQLSFSNGPAVPQHHATQYHNQRTAVYCICV